MQKREQDTKSILQAVETLNDAGRQELIKYLYVLSFQDQYKAGGQSKSRPQFEVIEGGRSGHGRGIRNGSRIQEGEPMRTREEIKRLYDTMLEHHTQTGEIDGNALQFAPGEIEIFIDIMHEKQREVCRPILEGLANMGRWAEFTKFVKARPEVLQEALAYNVPEPYRGQIVADAEP